MWSQKSWPYTHTKKLLNLNLISRWRYLMVSNKNSWYVTYVTKRWNEVLRLYIPSCTLKLKGYIWKDQEMESQNYEESLKNAQNWHGFTIISHLFPLTNNQWMILVWWILDVECFNGFCSLWNRYISLSHSATVRGKDAWDLARCQEFLRYKKIFGRGREVLRRGHLHHLWFGDCQVARAKDGLL